MIKKSTSFFLALLSAFLLILSFPTFNSSFYVWIGLIPLLILIEGQKKIKDVFIFSYLCGCVFYAVMLYWFVYVDPLIAFLGYPALVLYLGLYFALFGVGVKLFERHPLVIRSLMAASWWVILDFLRGYIIGGFDWVSLGHSQFRNLPMIQIADITSVFGVSFLIIMVNASFLILGKCILQRNRWKESLSLLILTLILFISVYVYGYVRLKSEMKDIGQITIGIVQANTPQDLKWVRSAWPSILLDYQTLTLGLVDKQPDIIIWPETSFPGIIGEEEGLYDNLISFGKSINTPLMFGSVIKEGEQYYNAARLVSADGETLNDQKKMHLVPFGEYLPLRKFIPFISQFIPIGDFSVGSDWILFRKLGKYKTINPFSVLICFEDSLARLSRKFVNEGAQLLINMTNDAWFADTRAPYLHVASAVFRSIENHRALVRVANSGVSCLILPNGKIAAYLMNEFGKKTFVRGRDVWNVPFSNVQTFYTKFGDFFILLCGLMLIVPILIKK